MRGPGAWAWACRTRRATARSRPRASRRWPPRSRPSGGSPPRKRRASGEDPTNRRERDVAARHDRDGGGLGPLDLALEDGGDRDGRGGLDQDLVAVEHEADGAEDLLLG